MLAEPLYLTGFIERMGTGIPDMVKACLAAGLKEPELMQEEEFKTILWRKVQATEQANSGLTPQVTTQVERLILIAEGEKSRDNLQEILGLKDRENFRKLYLQDALNAGLIEMTIPEKPNSKNQKYRLTQKGKILQQQLKKKKAG